MRIFIIALKNSLILGHHHGGRLVHIHIGVAAVHRDAFPCSVDLDYSGRRAREVNFVARRLKSLGDRGHVLLPAFNHHASVACRNRGGQILRHTRHSLTTLGTHYKISSSRKMVERQGCDGRSLRLSALVILYTYPLK